MIEEINKKRMEDQRNIIKELQKLCRQKAVQMQKKKKEEEEQQQEMEWHRQEMQRLRMENRKCVEDQRKTMKHLNSKQHEELQ